MGQSLEPVPPARTIPLISEVLQNERSLNNEHAHIDMTSQARLRKWVERYKNGFLR